MYSKEFQENLKILDSLPGWSGAPKGIISKEMARGRLKREKEESHSRALELFGILQRRIRTTEATILIIGTIVWGFGSLIQEAVRS